QSIRAEQFQTQQQRGDRTVGHTAEDRNQPDTRAKGRGQSHQPSGHTTKGSPGEKGGYNLAPLEAGAQGQSRKKNFDQKGLRTGLSRQGVGNVFHAGAVVIPGAGESLDQKGKGHD